MTEMVEQASFRLTRDGGDRGPSLVDRLSEQINQLSFASPFHRMRLKGRFPLKLIAVPEDPVAGNPDLGQRLKSGRLFRDGYGQAINAIRFDARDAPASWRQWVHGWGWLRDLASAGKLSRTDALRAEALARIWLHNFHNYDSTAWAPDVTGQRVLMAITHAPLVMPRHDDIHRSAVLNGIARWGRHLDRAAPRLPAGMIRLQAAAGLLGSALILPGGEERRRNAEALLANTLDQLLGDGGAVVSRSPLDLARIGRLLLTVSSFYRARSQRPSAAIRHALVQLRDGLAALAMGDGLPSSWHGGQASAADLALLGVEMADSPPQPAHDSGFQRLQAGPVRVMIDAGPPPPARLAACAHASTLAFTLTDGPHHLVVNCGGGANCHGAHDFPPELLMGLRSTAGHSTLVLADTNSTRLHHHGPRQLGGVEEVVVESRLNAEGHWFEGCHDGWRRRLGYHHSRRLWLAASGDDFRGEDRLLPVRHRIPRPNSRPLSIAIRFHLGPEAEASLTEDGRGALIRLGAGTSTAAVWKFRASFNHAPGILRLEPSLYVDADGEVQQIRQLLLTSMVEPRAAADISWSFRRQQPPTQG